MAITMRKGRQCSMSGKPISRYQQSINATLEFLHIVLYMAKPNIIAAKMASGNTTNIFVPSPIVSFVAYAI